jgi:dTDP-4-dehydrorhamnose reductase
MPHVAVAGISGRVGDSLRRFHPRRAEITGLVHNTAPITEGLTRVVADFDITDEGKVKEIVRELAKNEIRTIINSAGVIEIDGVEGERYAEDPTVLSAYQKNTRGAEILAEACAEVSAEGTEILLLHLSTESVFGDHPHGKKYTEEDQPNIPKDDTGVVNYTDTVMAPTWYGLTKALGEQKVWKKYGKGSVVVRMHGVQGLQGGFFARTAAELQNGAPFTRVKDMYVAHLTSNTVAEAILAIEEAMHDPGRRTRGIYHLSARNAITPYDITLRFADLFKKPRNLIIPISLEELIESSRNSVKPMVQRPHYTILDVSKFERDFYRLPTAEKEIDNYIQYLRQTGDE